MKIFNTLSDYPDTKPLALSLGMFDGVHLGHQKIIADLLFSARQKALQPSVLTFWPHPRLIFNPDVDLKLLSTIDEKASLLGHFGIENLFLKSFDEDFRNLTGEQFVRDILVEKLNVKHLIVGHDHVFGKNKSGNFELLQKLAPELGFEVQQTDVVSIDGENISSTRIRNLLVEGKISKANEMLGYPYFIEGTVVHGKKIGRTIGYPTANILVDGIKLLPKKGAYIVSVSMKNKTYKGMLNIGTNPTVGGENLTVEVYILDFNENIYDEKITVEFYDFLHEEIKFDGLHQLIERLDMDKKLTENFNFKNHKVPNSFLIFLFKELKTRK